MKVANPFVNADSERGHWARELGRTSGKPCVEANNRCLVWPMQVKSSVLEWTSMASMVGAQTRVTLNVHSNNCIDSCGILAAVQSEFWMRER
jgi:hypothetical protein